MEKRKVTVKGYFEMVREVIANADVANREELLEFIDKRIELQDKKRSGNSKKNEEIEAKVEEVYNALVKLNKPATATEIGNEIEYSNQRVSAYLKKLVDAGRVERVPDKRTAYYKIID